VYPRAAPPLYGCTSTHRRISAFLVNVNSPLTPSLLQAASSHDLYWSTGDGGPQGDDYNHSQDTTNFLGSIIRISVPSDGMGYAIPDGNLGSE